MRRTARTTADAQVGPPGEAPERELCGYRLLRRVHRGDRTNAYLAAGSDDALVVVRIFRDGAHAAAELRLDEEVECPHVASVLDVGATARDEVVLVAERLGDRLSQILERGGRLAAGSLVSLLAPLVSALAALHAAGYAHGSVNSAHIRFAADGRPVLTGADGGVPGTSATRAADVRAFSAVASQVLERTDPETRVRGARELIEWLADACERTEPFTPAFYTDLECRIFALAEPLPFALAEAVPEQTPEAALRGGNELRRREDRAGVLESVLEGEFGFSVDVVRQVAAALLTCVARLAPRWRVLGVGAIVFAIGLTAALVLIPGGAQAQPEPKGGEAVPSHPTTVAAPQLAARDALEALLEARRDCRSREDADCVAALYEAGASAADAEKAALTAGRSDPYPVLSLPATVRELGEPDSHGEAVIITVTATGSGDNAASVLLMETEAGWRIRDVFVG